MRDNEKVFRSYYDDSLDNHREISLPDDGYNFYAAYVESRTQDITYRVIYEDGYGKIEVPQEWYFELSEVIL